MSKSIRINGNIYSNTPYIDVPKSDNSGDARFFDTTDADAETSHVLASKTYYKDGLKTGQMPNNGDTSGVIATKNGTVQIPSGFTSGGTVQQDSDEKAKIISENIKNGITLFGQPGKSTVVDTEIASNGATASDIVSGKKGYVNGALIEGQATMPTIVQNTTTHALRIS